MSHQTRAVSVLDHLRALRQFPSDLSAIVLALLLYDCVAALAPGGTPLQALLGLGLLAFAPGYLLLAILVPGHRVRADAVAWRGAEGRLTALDGFERAALSVGCSVALLPLFALSLAALGVDYTASSLVVALNVGLFAGVVGAAYRRFQVPEGDRFTVTAHRRAWATTARQLREQTAVGVVNLLLALAVVLAASTMAYALVAPQDGEHASTLSVLTRSDDGDLIAGGYPDTLDGTDNGSLVVSVTNNEDRRTRYTVVAQLQRVDTGDGSVTVLEETELSRFGATVADGETWRHEHTPEPALSGRTLRLQYTLYRGGAPANASEDSAYRSVYLWVSAP